MEYVIWNMDDFVADDEVIDQEIEHPVQNEVTTSTCGIAKELRREPFLERTIEKNYHLGEYLR